MSRRGGGDTWNPFERMASAPCKQNSEQVSLTSWQWSYNAYNELASDLRQKHVLHWLNNKRMCLDVERLLRNRLFSAILTV